MLIIFEIFISGLFFYSIVCYFRGEFSWQCCISSFLYCSQCLQTFGPLVYLQVLALQVSTVYLDSSISILILTETLNKCPIFRIVRSTKSYGFQWYISLVTLYLPFCLVAHLSKMQFIYLELEYGLKKSYIQKKESHQVFKIEKIIKSLSKKLRLKSTNLRLLHFS